MLKGPQVGTDLEASPGRERVGPKRGRLLMRQERVKKEADTHTSPDSEPGSPGFPRHRSESGTAALLKADLRQRSEPTPASAPASAVRIKNEQTPSHNLLAVPQVRWCTFFVI